MYRKAGSVSVLSGALSGPYTGGKRTLDAALLDASVRERLDRATAGRGSPTPIAYERPLAFSPLPGWGITVATMLLSWLFAAGFGDAASTWGMQPLASLVLYLALGTLFAVSLLPLARRRLLFGGGIRGALRPGRYLFPLDAVDIGLPDETGRQLIDVRPLGNARDASVANAGKNTELVIAFEGGERVRFPLRGDPSGEIALRRLEHAQRLIEELSYSKDLEQAFANDVFFDIRVDASWERFVSTLPQDGRHTPDLRSLILGRFARASIVLLAVAVGGGAFVARRQLGGIALANQARQRQRILDAEAAAAKAKAEAEASAKPKPIDHAAARRRCIDSLEKAASKKHPKAAAYLVELVRQTPLDDRAHLTVEFITKVEGGDRTELRIPERELGVVRVLEAAFGRECQSALVVVPGHTAPGFVIHADVAIERATWDVSDEFSGEEARPHKVKFSFEASFRDGAGKVLEDFTLVLSPPAVAPRVTRPKSLFAVSDSAPLGARVAEAQSARAYDRLYDELWSLVFDGDPFAVWGAIDSAR